MKYLVLFTLMNLSLSAFAISEKELTQTGDSFVLCSYGMTLESAKKQLNDVLMAPSGTDGVKYIKGDKEGSRDFIPLIKSPFTVSAPGIATGKIPTMMNILGDIAIEDVVLCVTVTKIK